MMPTKWSAKAALTIFGMVIIPDTKTFAFGSVATGNMKAQLAASVAGGPAKNIRIATAGPSHKPTLWCLARPKLLPGFFMPAPTLFEVSHRSHI